uniref:Kit ligand n=1 Tax=Esox lucius TaxID=8010 RepID=A0AAY5KBI9_ESOLU
MKKPKIWIRVCVHLLLCIITLVQSSEFGNAVTDDITSISLLKQNIPKDYKIPVSYIPEDVGGMCWVTLNVFRLEVSLQGLAEKFGNISSNKYNISILIEMLKETRYHIKNLEAVMNDFECHYRDDQWQTGRYFHFVENILKTARSNRNSPEECDPPPCPTTAPTTTPLPYPSSGLCMTKHAMYQVLGSHCDIYAAAESRSQRKTSLDGPHERKKRTETPIVKVLITEQSSDLPKRFPFFP